MSTTAASYPLRPPPPPRVDAEPLLAPDPAMPPHHQEEASAHGPDRAQDPAGGSSDHPGVSLRVVDPDLGHTPEEFAAEIPSACPPPSPSTTSRERSRGNIPTYVLNSAIVTVGACALIVICGMMGAYAIQVLGFKGARIVRVIFLMGIVVPVQIALVPLFIDYSNIRLLDTICPSSSRSQASRCRCPSSCSCRSSATSPERSTRRRPSMARDRTASSPASPAHVAQHRDHRRHGQRHLHLERVRLREHLRADRGLQTIPLGLQNYIGNMGKTDWTATFSAVAVTLAPCLLVFLALNKAMIYGGERLHEGWGVMRMSGGGDQRGSR